MFDQSCLTLRMHFTVYVASAGILLATESSSSDRGRVARHAKSDSGVDAEATERRLAGSTQKNGPPAGGSGSAAGP